jgi:hypothetical protein
MVKWKNLKIRARTAEVTSWGNLLEAHNALASDKKIFEEDQGNMTHLKISIFDFPTGPWIDKDCPGNKFFCALKELDGESDFAVALF